MTNRIDELLATRQVMGPFIADKRHEALEHWHQTQAALETAGIRAWISVDVTDDAKWSSTLNWTNFEVGK